ncbi:MAG: tetratricopeptide repeat protein [Pyrinomonadaceae bacterium]
MNWQISAGAFTDALGPLAYLLAVVASTWLFAALRCRAFKMPAALALSLPTLLLIYSLPFVFTPMFIVAWMYLRGSRQRDVSTHSSEADISEAPTGVWPASEQDASPTSEQDASSVPDDASSATDGDGSCVTGQPDAGASLRRRVSALPLLYAALLIAPGMLYFLRDYRMIDAHLARAHRAELHKRTDSAIREYRAALRLEDDPHTHKLLGLQLYGAGRDEAALAEFDAAQHGGEPDALLAYHIASTLDSLGRSLEAGIKYEEFLTTSPCTNMPADAHCEVARSRLNEAATPRLSN